MSAAKGPQHTPLDHACGGKSKKRVASERGEEVVVGPTPGNAMSHVPAGEFMQGEDSQSGVFHAAGGCSIQFRRGRDGFSVPDGSHPHIRQVCSGTRAMQQQARGGVRLRMLYCLERVQTAVLGAFAEHLAPLQLRHSGQGGCRSWPSDFAVSADICRLNWSSFFSWAALALPARPLHSAGEAMEAAPSTVDNDPCTLHVSVKVATSPQVSQSPLGQLIAP